MLSKRSGRACVRSRQINRPDDRRVIPASAHSRMCAGSYATVAQYSQLLPPSSERSTNTRGVSPPCANHSRVNVPCSGINKPPSGSSMMWPAPEPPTMYGPSPESATGDVLTGIGIGPRRAIVLRTAQRITRLPLQPFAPPGRRAAHDLVGAPFQRRWRHETAHARVHQDFAGRISAQTRSPSCRRVRSTATRCGASICPRFCRRRAT